jgi:hypothetical protein
VDACSIMLLLSVPARGTPGLQLLLLSRMLWSRSRQQLLLHDPCTAAAAAAAQSLYTSCCCCCCWPTCLGNPRAAGMVVIWPPARASLWYSSGWNS